MNKNNICLADVSVVLKNLYFKAEIKHKKLFMYFEDDHSFELAERYVDNNSHHFSKQVEAKTVNNNERGIALIIW
jgi:hypothetical protein